MSSDPATQEPSKPKAKSNRKARRSFFSRVKARKADQTSTLNAKKNKKLKNRAKAKIQKASRKTNR